MNKSVLSSGPQTLGIWICCAFLLVSCADKTNQKERAALSFVPREYSEQPSFLRSVPNQAGDITDHEFLSYCLFEDICLLDELPIMRHTETNLTRDLIMRRVLTTQPWMQVRMRQLLNALPDAYIPLFGAVTAIAVTDKIPYPYYRSLNGAIYIPASFLWQTSAELDTLDGPQDNRAPQPHLTPYSVKWRYLDANGNDPFIPSSSNRTLKETLLPFAAMMAHELAHANDFAVLSVNTLPDGLSTFYDAFVADTEDARISTKLSDRYPIGEQIRQAAQQYYYPNDTNYSFAYQNARQLANDFEKSGASSFYGSHKNEEDMAMLFEEVMMKEFFDLDRYIAFTEFSGLNELTDPQGQVNINANITCDSFVVKWGEQNRFAADNTRERAQFVVENILPAYDFSSLFLTIRGTTKLEPEVSWCAATGTSEGGAQTDPRTITSPTNQDIWDSSHLEHFIPSNHFNSHHH